MAESLMFLLMCGQTPGICFLLVFLAFRKYCYPVFKLHMFFLYSSVVKRLFSFACLHTRTIVISSFSEKCWNNLNALSLLIIFCFRCYYLPTYGKLELFYIRKSKSKLLLSSDSFFLKRKIYLWRIIFFSFLMEYHV